MIAEMERTTEERFSANSVARAGLIFISWDSVGSEAIAGSFSPLFLGWRRQKVKSRAAFVSVMTPCQAILSSSVGFVWCWAHAR